MALERLIKLKRLAEDNFNRRLNVKPLDLSYFAMRMEDNEVPKQFYLASVSNVDGMLLRTDRQIMFVGKGNDHLVEGISLPIDRVKVLGSNIMNESQAEDKMSLDLESDGKIYTIEVSIFKINELMERLSEK